MRHAPWVDNRTQAEYTVAQSVLMGHSMMMRWRAVFISLALFGAMNYCTFEAFGAPPTHHGRACHAASLEHHGDKSSPPPARHHEGGSLACCAAMQAIAAAPLDVHLASVTTRFLHGLASGVLGGAAVRASVRTARGVSPPLREPTPVQPFYRTTFANHAPPVCIA